MLKLYNLYLCHRRVSSLFPQKPQCKRLLHFNVSIKILNQWPCVQILVNVSPYIFSSVYLAQGYGEPGVYPRGLMVQGRGQPGGQSANASQGTNHRQFRHVSQATSHVFDWGRKPEYLKETPKAQGGRGRN